MAGVMNFPASPTVGQQYQNGTTTYQYDGVVWNIVPQQLPATATDNPPPNPTAGQFWFRASNLQLYCWYDDGTSRQWVQAAGAATAGIWEQPFNKLYTGQLINDIVKDLGAYRTLKFFTDGRGVGADFIILAHPSTDNGVTFDTTASSFPLNQSYAVNGGAGTGNNTNQAGFTVANPIPQNTITNSGYSGEMTLQGWNGPQQLRTGHGRASYIDNAQPAQNQVNNSWTTARGVANGTLYNALKLAQVGGTGFIGNITILGMRG